MDSDMIFPSGSSLKFSRMSASRSIFLVSWLWRRSVSDELYLLLLKIKMPPSASDSEFRPSLDPNTLQFLPLTLHFRSFKKFCFAFHAFSRSWSSIGSRTRLGRTFVLDSCISSKTVFFLQNPTEVFPDQKTLFRCSSAADLDHLTPTQGWQRSHQYLIIHLHCFWDSNQFRFSI